MMVTNDNNFGSSTFFFILQVHKKQYFMDPKRANYSCVGKRSLCRTHFKFNFIWRCIDI